MWPRDKIEKDNQEPGYANLKVEPAVRAQFWGIVKLQFMKYRKVVGIVDSQTN